MPFSPEYFNTGGRVTMQMKARGRPLLIDGYVGTRIKTRRRMLKMSQSDLGRSVGISFQQIQKYENGRNRLSASRLVQFADILNVEVSYFFDGAEREKLKARLTGLPPYVAEFLELPEARRLMRAFVRINERSVRDNVTKLVTKLSVLNAASDRRIKGGAPARVDALCDSGMRPAPWFSDEGTQDDVENERNGASRVIGVPFQLRKYEKGQSRSDAGGYINSQKYRK